MDNQTLHETVGAFAYDLFETGDRIGEQLKDIYLLAIQMDCFPSPEKCDSRERMIKSLERLEGYLYDKTKELRSEANWLGKMQVRVIKVLEKIDEDGEDHDGLSRKSRGCRLSSYLNGS